MAFSSYFSLGGGNVDFIDFHQKSFSNPNKIFRLQRDRFSFYDKINESRSEIIRAHLI